jgi:hypothetical protein
MITKFEGNETVPALSGYMEDGLMSDGVGRHLRISYFYLHNFGQSVCEDTYSTSYSVIAMFPLLSFTYRCRCSLALPSAYCQSSLFDP